MKSEELTTNSDNFLKAIDNSVQMGAAVQQYLLPGIVEGVLSTKLFDAKQQRTQHAVEDVLKSGSPNATVVTSLTDGIAMTTQCQHDINQTRRIAVEQSMHIDFQAVSNFPISIVYSLFSDLSKHTKDITEANKFAKKVHPHRTATARRRQSSSSHHNFFSSVESQRCHPYQEHENFFHRDRSHNVNIKRGELQRSSGELSHKSTCTL